MKPSRILPGFSEQIEDETAERVELVFRKLLSENRRQFVEIHAGVAQPRALAYRKDILAFVVGIRPECLRRFLR